MAISADNIALQVTVSRALHRVLRRLAEDEHRSLSNFVMSQLTDMAIRRIGITNAEAQALLKAAYLQERKGR